MNDETYLGDGLYASFDGYQFKLRAPRENGDHVVYFEQYVIGEFMDYIGKTLSVKILIENIEPEPKQ